MVKERTNVKVGEHVTCDDLSRVSEECEDIIRSTILLIRIEMN